MTAKLCLFVGGCFDGKRKQVPDEWDVFNAAPPIPNTTLMDYTKAVPSSVDLRIDRYVRVAVVGAPDVFLCGDPSHLLEMLIAGYRNDKR